MILFFRICKRQAYWRLYDDNDITLTHKAKKAISNAIRYKGYTGKTRHAYTSFVKLKLTFGPSFQFHHIINTKKEDEQEKHSQENYKPWAKKIIAHKAHENIFLHSL